MFQLILLAAIVYFLFKWLRHSPPAAPRPRTPDQPLGQVEEMVQDPFCGTWIPLSQALASRQGNVTHHFCSAECRDKYQKKTKNQC